MQRREFIRADHRSEITLFDVRDPDAVAESGQTVNISGGGLLVRGFTTIEVGDELRADLVLEPGGPRIVAACRVVRVSSDGRHGVQFTQISEIDRDQIVEYAYGLDRARREMAISR
jgi:c-di-GMP-binding flagellar brake protein YcgR